MKLRKLTSWSATKKRLADKVKRSPVPKEKRNASSGGSPTLLQNNSGQTTTLSSRNESVPAEKGESKVLKEGAMIATTSNKGVFSNMEEDRPCFLFEDNEEDNVNENVSPVKKNNVAAESNLKLPIPLSPNADLGAPKNLFHLPQEITVNHLAVPPSPMKEPAVNIMASPSMNNRLLDDYSPGMYLNFQETSPRKAAPGLPCLGDPVGDIAMQRQLMDAQRLVRIILGKPLNKDHQELGASSILQAIRSYALMKAELINLRKKQEIIDDDPPAILLGLGSPAATTPSTTRTGACSGRRQVVQTSINDCDILCGSTGYKSPERDANLDAPITSALEQANETIRQLQKELATANETILELKEKAKGDETEREYQNTTKSIDQAVQTEEPTKLIHQEVQTEEPKQNDQQHNELEVGETKRVGKQKVEDTIEPNEDESCCLNSKESMTRNEDSQKVEEEEENHNQIVIEESKQDGSLDPLLDEIVLISQQVLTKDMVREKLELYYHTVVRQSSENQILEIKNKMRQSQEESDRQILELENKLKLQDQQHKEQLQAIMSEKEYMTDTKTDENKNMVLMELSHNTTVGTTGHLSSSIRKPMLDNAKKIITEEI